jgi:hypothetical protein
MPTWGSPAERTLVHGAWADGSSWSAVIERLQDSGYHVTAPQFPMTSQLGRPLVDRIHGSKIHNLKELRPRVPGSAEVRLLFVFDAEREAIVLVAGDKAGRWRTWYAEAIPLAEERYAAYQREAEEEEEEEEE